MSYKFADSLQLDTLIFQIYFWNKTLHVSGHFLCPSSGILHRTHSNVIFHTGLLTACEQNQDATASKLYDISHCCVQWRIPDDGQRNCPKHVEFHSKNKFENLVHLVGFIIRIYHDARPPERQIRLLYYTAMLKLESNPVITTSVYATPRL